MNNIWKQRRLPEDASAEVIREIAENCSVSEVTAGVLVRRGCTTPELAMTYLDPQWEDLHDPFLLPDMEPAVTRLMAAKENHEKVCVYGDYDADGTTGTGILLKYFARIGIDAFYRIPNRLKEGYGLNVPAVEAIAAMGAKVLLTVDNGISSITEAARCEQLGLDLIVTDHHECQPELPVAVAVVDAKRTDHLYPFKELCGAGVAFKLVQALNQKLGMDLDLSEYLEMAALATVADIVPLKDENRTIVALGLQMINDNLKNVGLKALVAVSETPQVTAGNLGYVIAPKINAAGRLGNADRVLDLYLAENESIAMEVALDLKATNEMRQAIEAEIYNMAYAQVESEKIYENDFIIAAGEDWHSGVIGIVASKLQEKWFHPVIVVGIDADGLAKGSCRSVPGVDIFAALSSLRGLFINFGGHEQAAGFSIRAEKLNDLKVGLAEWARINGVAEKCVRTFYYDSLLDPEAVDFELLEELERCEPTGVGNPGPVFKMIIPKAEKLKRLGKLQNHLAFETAGLRCVGFDLAEAYPWIAGGNASVLCKLKKNAYNGNISVQPNILDLKGDPLRDNQHCFELVEQLRYGEVDLKAYPEDRLMPTHEMIAAVYKAYEFDQVTAISFDVLRDGMVTMNSFQLLMALNALKEVGLLAYRLKSGVVYAKKIKTNEKKDIKKANIMVKLLDTINTKKLP